MCEARGQRCKGRREEEDARELDWWIAAWCDGRVVLSWAGGGGGGGDCACTPSSSSSSSSMLETFFDRAPASASQNEGSAAGPHQPTLKAAALHICELSPPTVPTIPPTPILLLDLLEHSHSHNTAQRIQRVESVGGRRARAHPLHDSSRNHPAGRPRMAKQRVAKCE